jgi:hypothetical protein
MEVSLFGSKHNFRHPETTTSHPGFFIQLHDDSEKYFCIHFNDDQVFLTLALQAWQLSIPVHMEFFINSLVFTIVRCC